jgi:hypothetical protein
MLVCDADGVTWSVTRYELGDPARLPAALTELRDKLTHNIGAEEHKQPGALPLGAAALAEAGRSHMAGQRPNGDKVQAQALFFGEATRAYQLVAILPATASPHLLAQTGQFFDGVQIAR